MTESFGMQLDDDSLLALFSRVMTHPSATLTCYEGCMTCLYTALVHFKVQKHATCCIQHEYIGSHGLVLQQLTAIHDTTGPVRSCHRLWWDCKQPGVFHCIKALNPL